MGVHVHTAPCWLGMHVHALCISTHILPAVCVHIARLALSTLPPAGWACVYLLCASPLALYAHTSPSPSLALCTHTAFPPPPSGCVHTVPC